MKLLIELDEEYINAIDKIEFLVGGRSNRKLQLEIIKAIKNGQPLEQESTTRNCFGCKYSKDNHNAGTEECHLCMWENQYTPTTKNDLGVDAISRAEAQTEIEMNASRYTIAKERGGMGQVEWSDQLIKVSDAVDIIRHLPSVTPQEPRWIPVSEYLPVTNDEVLVTYIVNGNAKKRYVETANYFDGEWSSANDEYRIPNTKIEIIAWCEMPKPYKAETEDKAW